MATYAYSFNGENYTGNFDTREKALARAIEAARWLARTPDTIYVAEKIAADPLASGHAGEVIHSMSTRAKSAENGPGAAYLRNVTAKQKGDLDASLEGAITGWLQKNNLTPSAYSVRAISEHSMPQSLRAATYQRGTDEVSEIGVSDSPLSAKA